jgi:hypothetical protein
MIMAHPILNPFLWKYLPMPLLTLMATVPPHTKLVIKKVHLNFVISLFKVYLKYHPFIFSNVIHGLSH